MKVQCSNCQEAIEFIDKRPAYCGHCGHSLSQSSNLHEAATQAYAAAPSTLSSGDVTMGGELPRLVGRYRLGRELGHGGMGVVYEAVHDESGRRVALKLLTPGMAQSQESMDRFLREGRLAAALSHSRSTFVYEAGAHAGQPYIAMELMPGRTLHHVCADEGPLPVVRAVDYILDVIDGLEAAHAVGVIHRDVKPSNCFLDDIGRVKVGDFGLSKSLAVDTSLTRTGAFMGTPLFAAPEQVKAGKIDPRTDVYAVGATLFYLIAGRGPFTGDPAAVIAQISSDPAPPLHGLCPAVPKDLDQVIARTLEKNPDDRFETLNELRKALLPFSSQGLAPATVGLRLGAYFIDTMLIGLVGGILGAAMFIWSSFVRVGSGFDYASDGLVAEQSPIRKSSLLITQLGCFTFSVLYFGLLEGRTGRSLGKRILGLRVVGSDGGRPGVFRAAMRAVLVPGLMWLSMSLILPLAFPRGLEIQTTSRATLLAQATQQLALVPILICLATMRSSNGYRGLHDMFTRTRVVTLRGSSQRGVATELPTVVPVVTAGEVEEYGPYRVVGSLGWGRDSRVYQARDETLNRRVWIYKKEGNGDAIDETRVRVGRPTRPRWLLGGVSDGRRWEAFESVAGSPISALTHDRGTISWEQGRIILRDLAGEIGTALDEGTLPAGFSIDHVWVDREGRVKLLEQPLETGPSSTEHSSQSPDAATAMAVLRTLVGSCTRAQLLPAHAYDFVVELSNRPDSRETLDWATGLLRELCERPGVLRWSDRLVALGVTMGAEYSFYNAAASVLVYCVFRLFEFSLVESLLVAASIAIVLPAVMAWLLRGGPVFHFIGISVRLRDGRPAGRLRCAWRSMLAWFPLMLTFAINIAVLPSVASMQVRGRTNPNETAQEILSREELLLIASAMPSLILLIFSLGLVYAVLHPNRGIQDLLSGTRIVPQ